MRAGTTTTMHLRHRADMGCSLPQDPISSDLNSCIQRITGECLVFICHVCSAFVIWWYACSGQLLAVLFRYFDPYRVSVQFVVFAPPMTSSCCCVPQWQKAAAGDQRMGGPKSNTAFKNWSMISYHQGNGGKSTSPYPWLRNVEIASADSQRFACIVQPVAFLRLHMLELRIWLGTP